MLDLSVFGQAAPAMLKTAQLSVILGHFQEPRLRLGRCFHVPKVACRRPEPRGNLTDLVVLGPD